MQGDPGTTQLQSARPLSAEALNTPAGLQMNRVPQQLVADNTFVSNTQRGIWISIRVIVRFGVLRPFCFWWFWFCEIRFVLVISVNWKDGQAVGPVPNPAAAGAGSDMAESEMTDLGNNTMRFRFLQETGHQSGETFGGDVPDFKVSDEIARGFGYSDMTIASGSYKFRRDSDNPFGYVDVKYYGTPLEPNDGTVNK